MKLLFKSSFVKDLHRVKVKRVLSRVKELIEIAEGAEKLDEIPNLKKLAGAESHYRIRIGNYRLGLVYGNETIIFVRILHRKDIYRYFP